MSEMSRPALLTIALLAAPTAAFADGASPTQPAEPRRPATPAHHGCPLSHADATSAINAGSIVGTLDGAPDETEALCSFGPSGEQVFAIRPTQPGQIDASLANPGTTFEGSVIVRSDCDSTDSQLACGIFSASFQAEACRTYYIIVEALFSGTGDFELTIAQTPSGPTSTCHGDGATPAEPADPADPNAGEGPATPPTFACEHDVCATGGPLTAVCSDCSTTVCENDPYCCDVAWDAICVNATEAFCGLICPSECGDFYCEPPETCESCAVDCGECFAATSVAAPR